MADTVDSKFREMRDILSHPENRSKNSVSLLLEVAAQVGESVTFTYTDELALSNMKLFTCEVKVGRLVKCRGTAHNNKKVAKAYAADQALEMVKNKADVSGNSPGTSQVSFSPSASSRVVLIPAAGDFSNTAFNSIGSLQELCLKNKWTQPSYKIVPETGEAHAKTFICECKMNSWGVTLGRGKSKKSAKKLAAGNMLTLIREKTTTHYQEDADGLSTRLIKPLEKKRKKIPFLADTNTEFSKKAYMPSYVVARGPRAIAAYLKAKETGTVLDRRVKILLIGQDRVGKTSVGRSLKGEKFRNNETSTDGVQMHEPFQNPGRQPWKNFTMEQETTAYHHKCAEYIGRELNAGPTVEQAPQQALETGF